ncbi:MAG: 1,6-anhydro-N-acetylmuramyl-L-alanine amidase AmpD [Steroidobacteraceae bacterium]
MGAAMQSGFSIDGTTGLLREARQVLSPHFDERPQGTPLELIVVHGISLPPGEFGGPYIEHLFTGGLDPNAHPYFAAIASMRVSSHLLVRRNGEVVQFVPFGMRAWHAGESSWQGRPACNDFSIGIEMEGTDDGAYEAAQYQALAALISALCETYPTLARERVVGHSDISPERKTDPGPAFTWPLLRQLLS